MNKNMIEEAAQRYGITPKNLVPLPGGHFAQVFGFELADRACVLRLTPPDPEINLASTRAVLAFLKYLAAGGVGVPEPVPSLAGNLVEILPDPEQPGGIPALATVFVRAEGALAEEMPVAAWEDSLLAAIGQAVGRFHAVSRGYVPASPALDRPHWNQVGSCFAPRSETAAAADPASPHHWVLDKRAALLAEIERLPRDPGCYGIIHADLHFGNFFFYRDPDPASPRGWAITLLDFDDCLYGWYEMDIAMNLLDALVLRRPADEASFTRRFLECYLPAYQSETALDPAWSERLPLFLKLLETGLYLMVAEAYEPGDSESWIGSFMTGRRVRIENDVPVVPPAALKFS